MCIKKFKKVERGAKMRNPNRLDEFYNELTEIHKQYFPDWRFGQFMYNFISWMQSEKQKDVFFPEEDKMIEYIKEYAKIYKLY